MARRPQGTVRKSPRLKQGKPKPPGVGRPSPRPKKSKGPAGGPKPKGRINPQQPKGFPDRFERFKAKIDRNPTVQGRAMGGQAQEGGTRGALRKKRITARQQELMDMLKRLYGGTPGPTIRRKPKKDFMERPFLPKDKPKPKPVRPFLPKGKPKGKPKRAK